MTPLNTQFTEKLLLYLHISTPFLPGCSMCIKKGELYALKSV